jgi:very-short-patch-repair endonuclease
VRIRALWGPNPYPLPSLAEVSAVSAPSDRDLARLAGPLRILRLDQLRHAGLSAKAVRHRVDEGRLQRLWPGVFLVGPDEAGPLSRAYGATESYTGATYVDRIWGCFVHEFAPAPAGDIDVLVVTGSRAPRKGIVPHHSRTLAFGDLGHAGKIPVVSPARAILGAAETATPAQVEALVAAAHAKGKVTNAQLKELLQRAGRTKGATRLRLVVEDTAGGMTLSEAERILRRLLKKAGLPQPLTNYKIGKYYADFCWPAHHLIVEFNSWAHHGHRKGFRHDGVRNSHLTAKGWSVLPVTDEMLSDQPYLVVALISEALTRRQSA